MTGDTPPTRLRVDHAREPAHVPPGDDPRFSWEVPGNRRQSAWQVQVARRDPDFDAGLSWDSGRTASAESIAVSYAGPPLVSNEVYHWRVRIWDADGEPCSWSEPASFGTGLEPADWDGAWITHQPDGGDSNGWRSRWRPVEFTGEEWVQVDLGGSTDIETIELHPTAPIDGPRTPDGLVQSSLAAAGEHAHPIEARGPEGFGFPSRYRIEVADEPGFEDAVLLVENTEESHDNPRSEPRTFDVTATGRYVRVTATELDVAGPAPDDGAYHAVRDERTREEHRHWRVFALAALGVRDGVGTDRARDGTVSASSSVEEAAWGRSKLVDGRYASAVAAPSPQLRTEFQLDQPIKRARLHVATLGWGETVVNGEALDETALNPAWTNYDDRVLYRTYDLADRLREGTNALGLWLGRGWFARNDYAWTGFGSPRALLQLSIEYVDGTTTRVVSDDHWTAAASPILENDIYDGERYDARREHVGWARPEFDDTDWAGAATVNGPGGVLRPHRVQPVAPVERFEPTAIEERDGAYLVDVGQNLTGYLEFEITDPTRGTEIELTHAESRTPDGGLATEDLRSADARDVYVAAGRDRETYRPRFTYHGFRYARIAGYPGELSPADVTAVAVHTAARKRGSFSCDNEDLNAVQHAAEWSLRGNTFGVPTGCAQRDERTGWTGDAHLSARALEYNFDAGRFHAKWARDHDDEQSPHGYTPDTVPYVHGGRPGDPSWTLTRMVIPWYHYQFYGDDRVLRAHYDGMRGHVEYWDSLAENGYVPAEYGSYGDWLAFENTGEPGSVGEPKDLFITAAHYRATRILAHAADILEYDGDAERYEGLASEIQRAFTDRFFDADRNVYEPETQAAFAVPLAEGLVPPGREGAVATNLAEKVRSDGSRLLTGFLGTRALLFALTDHGHVDLAYELVSSSEQPGWVYMVRDGATTLWERWNSDDAIGSGMNSFNHHQFAYVSEWFFSALAGLRFETGECADGVFDIAPRIPTDLDRAAGEIETPYGLVSATWERGNGSIDLTASLPGNAGAAIRLPIGDVSGTVVRYDEEPIWNRDGEVERDGPPAVESGDGAVRVHVGPGTHRFELETS